MTNLTPREIVSELDRFIIGQNDAKRSVAVALRNRWRRNKLDDDIRDEVYPKNILMIGPTGVGKTEISRRLAKLANAPFLKVEATKFTEVGYVGRDVEQIVRDLVDSAIVMIKENKLLFLVFLNSLKAFLIDFYLGYSEFWLLLLLTELPIIVSSINPLSIVHPEPILVPLPIITAPICGIINVLDLSGIKPKPNFPITVFGAIFTSSPRIENSIKTPDEIIDLFPILLF